MEKFCIRLRACRQEKGMTQEDTAHELGFRYSTYCRYEHGGTEPTISDAARIADFFGVTLDYLAGRSDEPGRQGHGKNTTEGDQST